MLLQVRHAHFLLLWLIQGLTNNNVTTEEWADHLLFLGQSRFSYDLLNEIDNYIIQNFNAHNHHNNYNSVLFEGVFVT